MARIIYTHTDEAPLLATYSFLPIIEAYAAKAGVDVETRDISLAGRIIAQFPDRLTDEQRQADDAWPSSVSWRMHARGQHHQAAQRLGLGPAAQGGGQGAAGAGLRPARLPREPAVRRGQGDPRPLRQGHGLGGQPGAARGQLRPPRAGLGQGLRQGPPAPHGRLVVRLEDQRRDDGQGRLPLQRAVGGHRVRRHPAHRARRRRRHRDRAQGVDPGAGRRGRRRHLHERRGAAPLPRRADRPGQGRGRAVLGAPQGHDDEGLRPDHLRPRRPGLLPDALRAVRRRAQDRGHLAQRRPRRAALRGRRAARGRRDQGRRSSRGSTTAPTWRWSTPTRASPTCTCPPT